MANYAKINQGKVVKVIVAEASFFDNFVDDSPGTWIKTSYNTHGGVHYTNGIASADQSKALRKNYAGIGYSYDEGRDAFIPPKFYASWVLNETSCLWEAPVSYPDDGQQYTWNEETTSWDLITD